MAAHWLQEKRLQHYAYDVRLAFFQRSRTHLDRLDHAAHDGTQTEHGFASLFRCPARALGLAWLDGRQ